MACTAVREGKPEKYETVQTTLYIYISHCSHLET